MGNWLVTPVTDQSNVLVSNHDPQEELWTEALRTARADEIFVSHL